MSDSETTPSDIEARVSELELELAAHAERTETLEAERDEYLEDLKRLAAEFDNFRKRAARERDAIVQRANARLIGECLDILDDLERAIAAAEGPGGGGQEASSSDPTVLEGVALVEKRLRGLLEREGISEIDTSGAFDPHIHEALLTQPSEDPEGTILGVMQKGYALGDHVLRPARVAVAGPLESSGDAATDAASVTE
jgi:molecular chaperone GrpE